MSGRTGHEPPKAGRHGPECRRAVPEVTRCPRDCRTERGCSRASAGRRRHRDGHRHGPPERATHVPLGLEEDPEAGRQHRSASSWRTRSAQPKPTPLSHRTAGRVSLTPIQSRYTPQSRARAATGALNPSSRRAQERREAQRQRCRGRRARKTPPSRSAKRNVSHTVAAAATAFPSTKNALRSASGLPTLSPVASSVTRAPQVERHGVESGARCRTASSTAVGAAMRVHVVHVERHGHGAVLDDVLGDLVGH